VLWKPSANNEPGWDSLWGLGRPGWHIECSAMSKKYLGETFDIHGGGIDLSFPHHENELAQSCCANGTRKMAQIWMHNGFLQIEGEKMSKSEGNFFTVHDLLHTDKFGGRKWPGDVLRLAMLMTHYRKPIDFSIERLNEAETHLQRMYLVYGTYQHATDPQGVTAMASKLLSDLDTISAVGELFRFTKNAVGISGFDDELAGEKHPPTGLESVGRMISAAKFLGLLSDDPDTWINRFAASTGQTPKRVEASIALRLAAIAEKNWAEADKIRDELAAKGIKLADKKDPTTGERITTWEVSNE
jgi:cysteinyl-tRNA synthetase